MIKIILLDWDGPISNSRTWKMPHHIDPVAVQLLNEAYDNGWQVVLTSTIRKHYADAQQATADFNKKGISVQFFRPDTEFWRTNPQYTAFRHLEFLQWYSDAPLPDEEHCVFVAIDDENYPHVVTANMAFYQDYVNTNEGIGSISLQCTRDMLTKTDEEIVAYFNLEET